MHSPRQKKPKSEHAGRPTHSQMGNPYPQGLEPHIIKYERPDKPNCWPQPLVEAEIPPPGGIVADYLFDEPDPQWPRLRLRLAPRGSRQTDEQYEACRRDIEQFTCDHSLYLGLCQELCTHLGNHHDCTEGPCRRNGACAGIRDQDRFAIPFVLFQPCVPLDREIIGTYREEIVAELKRVVARGEDALAEGQRPETAAVRPVGEKIRRPLPVAHPAKTA